MKKIIILLFAIFPLFNHAISQTLSIEYEMSLKLSEAAKKLPEQFVQGMTNIVIAFKYRHIKNRSEYTYFEERFKDASIPKLNMSKKVSVSTYKDFNGKFLYQTAKEIPGAVSKETLRSNEKWKIKNDTCVILGYKCQNATLTHEREGLITAWYAIDIPVSDGPGKFHGLPGIILKVETDAFSLESVSIKTTGKNGDQIIMPTAEKYLTQVEFENKVKKYR